MTPNSKRLTNQCIALLVVGLLADWLLSPPLALAESKTVTAEGTYTMGDGETPLVAEARALQNAKRAAVEQVGTYVQSFSKTQNFQLTDDELLTIAGAVIETEVLERKRSMVAGGLLFYVKIKATVTGDNIIALADRAKQKGQETKPDVLQQYRELQANYDRLAKEIDSLKERLGRAKSEAEQRQATAELAQKERRYLAAQWKEKGDEAHYKQHDNSKALEYYSQAIRTDPTFDLVYFARGLLLDSIGQTEAAVADFTESIRLHTDTSGLLAVYYSRAQAYSSLKQHDKAAADWTEALRLLPIPDTSFRQWFLMLRGFAYAQMGKYREAIADHSEAISLDPADPSAYEDRGMVYMTARQLTLALDDFSKAITLAAESGRMRVSAYILRGWTYHQLRKTDEAIADLSVALKLEPDSKSSLHAYYLRARAYLVKHQLSAALADYSDVLRLDPGHSQALLERAVVYSELNRYSEAITDLTALIHLGPGNEKASSAYEMRGYLYWKLSDTERAISDLSEAIRLNPKSPKPYAFRGSVYAQLGKVHRAESDFRTACDLGYGEACDVLDKVR